MDLVRGGRRPLEYGESRVGENALVRQACRPVLTRHVTVVSCGSAPGEAVAFVVCAHSVKTAATGQLSLEVIDA